ncbi:MAG TPA: AI-2E family transporter [Acidimicrobiales bacterium]|nr:AI-2E family transporter [Acidimicrobiales bacterium]
MAAPQPRERLRLTPRSLVVAVALFGAMLVGLRVLAASERVVGWVLAAMAVAGLLHPYVNVLAHKLPRGLAVIVAGLLALGSTAVIVYAIADGVVREYHEVQEAAPLRAQELEQHGRFHNSLRDFELSRRVKQIVDQAPDRLRGGTPADAIRAAATRGIAFLATGILALFFMLHGPRMAQAAADQVHTPSRKAELERVGIAAFRRGFGYARGTLAMSMLAGLLSWALASWANVPGPAPLALWVALWDVVPVIGAAVGAHPLVGLAAIASPEKGVLLAVVFLAYQLLEWLFLQRWIDRRTVHVGPFITVVAGFIGLELYGVGGSIIMLLAVALGLAALDELTPSADDREARTGEMASGAVADGGQVGPVGRVEVDGGRAAESLAHEV